MDLKPKYQETVNNYQPFVLCPEENLDNLGDEFLGQQVEHFDSYGEHSEQLTEMLLELDAQAYDGLPMDQWVSVDACQETCGIIGFGTYDEEDSAVSDLDIPQDYEEIIPVSEFAGGFKPGNEFVINTLSVADKQEGLGAPTAALASEVVPEDEWYAVSQYDNPAPIIYSKLGDMEFLEASVPGHSKPEESFKFGLTVEDESVEQMLTGDVEQTEPDMVVGIDDEEKKQHLQQTDKEYKVLPPGSIEEDGELKLALTEVKN